MALFTTAMHPDYTPVIFGTLTQPNATLLQTASGRAGLKHIEAVEHFLSRACLRWRVHLLTDIGWEDTQNQHSHVIISVLNSDLDRFHSNQDRFDPHEAWRWNGAQIDWQVFDQDNEGDVWAYVMQKHTHLQEHRCPKRGPCRRGCIHR